jgi:hypothetical protein
MSWFQCRDSGPLLIWSGGRLFSSYLTAEHGKLWIITDDIRGEGEGPLTTVMFPEDY